MSSEWSTWYAEEDPTTWVLGSILRDRADAHGDRPYLRYGDGGWVTYGEMNERANRIANGLIARGVQRGESVSDNASAASKKSPSATSRSTPLRASTPLR